jgi:hypothetical protein
MSNKEQGIMNDEGGKCSMLNVQGIIDYRLLIIGCNVSG